MSLKLTDIIQWNVGAVVLLVFADDKMVLIRLLISKKLNTSHIVMSVQ